MLPVTNKVNNHVKKKRMGWGNQASEPEQDEPISDASVCISKQHSRAEEPQSKYDQMWVCWFLSGVWMSGPGDATGLREWETHVFRLCLDAILEQALCTCRKTR